MRLSWLSELIFGAWCMILMNGTATVVTEECSGDNISVYTTKGRICCPKCEGSHSREPCNHDKMECRCRPGYGCQTKTCTECNPVPKCNSGDMLSITDSDYSFYKYDCKQCPSGKVLDMESGLCILSKMFTTLLIPTTKDPTTKNPTPDSKEPIVNNSNTWIFICIFVAFCFSLITIVIHLLIRKMKTEKTFKMEGDLVQPHSGVPINIKEDGDTLSYQYPEEEHGDGHMTNKLAAF